MAPRRKKCKYCGDWIEVNETSIQVKNRYVHEKCFNVFLKATYEDKAKKLAEKEEEQKNKTTKKKAKPKAELKDALSEEEYQDKKKYYEYLKELIKEEELPAKVYAVTNDNIKKYDFTFLGMYQTLVYLNEALEKKLTEDVAGLIPYYYTAAQKYFENIKEANESNEDKDVSTMYKEKTLFIQPSFRRLTNQIDINSIEIEEE